MNYEQMSDAEISQKVGELTSKNKTSIIGANDKAFITHFSAPVGRFGEFAMGWKEFDPCNRWADAGPIIQENKISISPRNPGLMETQIWEAKHYLMWDPVCGENPLRMAMIAFLMIQKND